ncbi:hypothetical protein [Cellulosimicrobium sp. 22601]|uniref:hypothetical protein n=1 Tax=unclassified Cellulosimicrobium TaxID=2624466 RepID=UPI003F8554E6
MPYEPVFPEGQHLGTSHQVAGAFTGHLFDDETGDLKGHAAWRWVEEPEADDSSGGRYEPPVASTAEDSEGIDLAALIAALAVVGIVAATPHIKRWWNDKGAPKVKAALKRIVPWAKGEVPAHTVSSEVVSTVVVGDAPGTEVAVSEPVIVMSLAEWQYRFQAMLAAGAFQDEQRRILSGAHVVDGPEDVEARTPSEQLTPGQFADRIRGMLEANPSLHDEETSRELMRIFSTRALGLPAAVHRPAEPQRPTMELPPHTGEGDDDPEQLRGSRGYQSREQLPEPD